MLLRPGWVTSSSTRHLRSRPVLVCRLAWNHPLPDGNKRAAWAALVVFIDLNHGTWDPNSPSIDKAEGAMLAIAGGDADEASTPATGTGLAICPTTPGSSLCIPRRSPHGAVWPPLIRGMDERRCELATLGAARQLRSSYCSLAHGKILRDKFYDADQVRRMAEDPASSDLEELDKAIVELAGKVARDATSLTLEDIDGLRALGLDDREAFDVILAAAARCFFSKVIDATGTVPDRAYLDLEPELREALVVGRPIEEG